MKKWWIWIVLVIVVAVVVLLLLPGESKVKQRIIPGQKKRMERKQYSHYPTCKVCGYHALDSANAVCLNCGKSVTPDQARSEGVQSLRDLIVLYQLEYFLPENDSDEIDFYNPPFSKDVFPKDDKWSPSVYQSEVYDFYRIINGVDSVLMADSLSD